MLIDIYMEFREDSLNGFQVIEHNFVIDRQTKFQGKLLKKYKSQSYDSCALHVV